MSLHVSSKLFVVVLVVAALITAFRSPIKLVNIHTAASVSLAKQTDVSISPGVFLAPARPLEVPVATVELRAPEVVVAEPIAEEATPVEAVAEPVVVEAAAETLTYTLKSTAYNSHVSQTDSSPNITATGATTAFGVIAMSRDMLEHIPYGSLVRLKDMGSYHSGRGEGKYQDLLNSQGYFIVEDTMHPRKVEQIDVWFAHESEALSWGVRQVELEVVRVGRDGPMLEQTIVATQ
jgi:3D (Asp-Asp-Asp) domain-containing protein